MLVIKLCIKNEKSCSQHPIVQHLPIECLTSYPNRRAAMLLLPFVCSKAPRMRPFFLFDAFKRKVCRY